MLNRLLYSVHNKLPALSKRNFLLFLGLVIFVYAIAVLVYVTWIPDLGIQSALKPQVKRVREVEDLDIRQGWVVTKVGDFPIQNWFDLLQSPQRIKKLLDDTDPDPSWAEKRAGDERPWIPVSLKSASGEERTIHVPLDNIPFREMVPSLSWFALKLGLFVVGGLVLWKRPTDPSAVLFFLLCIVTLGAFTGGYHWSRLVTVRPFFLIFLACAVLLPAVSLHNYHVFPRRKAWLVKYPRLTFAVIYGPTLLFLVVLAWIYLNSYVLAIDSHAPSEESRTFIERVIYLEFGLAAVQYFLGVVCLVHSYRLIVEPMERNQVKFILMGASLALLPIGYSLYLAIAERDAFSAGAATWPMFLASAFITIAYAISITRYRLMELDQIVSSGVGYFVTSFVAAALYYLIVFLGTLIFSQYNASGPSLSDALTVSTTALILMLGLDFVRSRLKKALDRRYFRDKSQLDRTLQRLGQEIEKLVDTPSLAIKMLNTTAEVLGVKQGAIYLLQEGESHVYRLEGAVGVTPSLEELLPNYPLVAALQSGKVLLERTRLGPPPSSAQKQLQYLRGEVAQPLMHENRLLAVLILGPKDPPYKPEDFELLTALAQITALAIGSAEGHRIIEHLNKDLQSKVQKISEQQRRIMALQSQLRRQAVPVETAGDAVTSETAEPAVAPEAPLPAGIVGSSPAISQLIDLVRKVAATDAVVLLRGESGTGKELLARAVYETSPRVGKPFVKVHCAALAPTLLESELFGHVKGAFTGAHKDKIGRFEMANGGTLFLDEIGDISLEVQTKLLRVLQEKTIERVGSAESMAVDVRIITATHQNLENLIRQGRFREDLFYRLNVFPIYVPPLRQRVEDIEDLVRFFVQQSSLTCKKEVTSIDDDALDLLLSYPWPGNIRELQNVIERAVVISESATLTLNELPRELLQREQEARGEEMHDSASLVAPDSTPSKSIRPMSAKRQERQRREREELLHALASADGNKAEAARALGMARSTLVSRLKKLGLD